MTDLHPDLAKVLITPEQIQHRVQELAAQLNQDYHQVNRLYIIGILKGAFIWMEAGI